MLSLRRETRSPVIIGTAEALLPYTSLEELAYFIIPMAKKATVPVVVNFDHGLTAENVNLAMELGFSSIMYDCSTMSYEDNCNEVARMVKIAHSRGISVEAELGHIGANEDGSSEGDATESIYTSPDEAVDFMKRTNADALAIAIGTAHGAYKFTPKLDFDRLSKISSLIDTPLVLHGGSGLSEQAAMEKMRIFGSVNKS